MVADLVLIGLGIALQPFRLSAFTLILGSEGGTRKGLGFILGWLACLALVISLVALGTGGRPVRLRAAPSTALLIAKLALGAALIVIAAVQWHRRNRPGQSIDQLAASGPRRPVSAAPVLRPGPGLRDGQVRRAAVTAVAPR